MTMAANSPLSHSRIMLSLESPRWRELEHAYGHGGDVPQMLRSFKARRPDARSCLWGALCHQYSVYSATIAAVPHIVEAIASFPIDERLDDLVFLGTVAAYAPDELVGSLDPEIQASYQEALNKGAILAVDMVEATRLNYAEFAYLLQAIAALHGCKKLGKALSGFADAEFLLICPGCECEIYLWPSEAGMTTSAEDPVAHKETLRLEVEPRRKPDSGSDDEPEFTCESAFVWLSRFASDAGQHRLLDQLRFLYGTAVCPKCSASFPIVEHFA